MVKMSAKATDPLIVPEAQTTESSLLGTFQFMQNLKMKAKPKMAMNLAIKQMTISAAMKVIEKTSLEK